MAKIERSGMRSTLAEGKMSVSASGSNAAEGEFAYVGFRGMIMDEKARFVSST